jgi:Retinal pigment epithelial membrane protein
MKEWTKAFLSQPEEFDYLIPEDDIDGELPADLCGSLFRNRPGLFERGRIIATLLSIILNPSRKVIQLTALFCPHLFLLWKAVKNTAIIWTVTATSLALLSRMERYAILFLIIIEKATSHR